jgi:hypothetical protein
MDDNGSIKNSSKKNSGKDETRKIVPESKPGDNANNLRTNLLENTENSSSSSSDEKEKHGKCCSVM